MSKEENEFANKKRLEHEIKLDSRKNKLNFVYDSNGKKIIYTESKGDFIYKAKVFQVSEKTLIKMLYVDAISVFK